MENIYTTLEPFYILSKILGVFPKSFVAAKQKGILKLEWFDVVITCCSLFTACVLFAVEIISQFNLDRKISVSLKFWSVSLYLETFMLFIQFTIQILNSSKIELFLKQLHKFDQKVST